MKFQFKLNKGFDYFLIQSHLKILKLVNKLQGVVILLIKSHFKILKVLLLFNYQSP